MWVEGSHWDERSAMSARAPEELHALVEAAFNDGDADVLVSVYDEDATLIVPPRAERATGRVAIRRVIEATLRAPRRMRIEVLDKLETDGLALTHARWTLSGADPHGASGEMSGWGTVVSR